MNEETGLVKTGENLPAKPEPEKTIMQEAEEMAIQEIAENMLPKISKYIKPMKGKLSKFLGDDEKMVTIRKDKETGEVYLMVIEMKGVEAMRLTKGTYKIYQIEKFVDMLADGDIAGITKEIEDNT